MLRKIIEKYWWPGLTKDVTEFVASPRTWNSLWQVLIKDMWQLAVCDLRQAFPKQLATYGHLAIRETRKNVQHDLSGIQGSHSGDRETLNLLVVIDHLGKWPEVAVVKSRSLEKIHFRKDLSLHWMLARMTSYNGPP